MQNTVVLRYLDGGNKVELLNDVLDRAGLEGRAEAARRASGRSREEFRVVIKPNASMFIRRDEEGVTTDPVLVLALVERLIAAGFVNVALVESSNLYAAGFENREPVRVMAEQGMAGGVAPGEVGGETALTAHVLDSRGEKRPYTLADLTADTVAVESGLMHGKLKLGRAWAGADFRISFAKFKTHIYDGYTLLVKNTYGCLPESNKMWHYHYLHGAAKPAIAQLAVCPVHFGIIDAVTAADGQAGVKWDRAIARRPGFILAGGSIGGVERAACGIMGVSTRRSRMSRMGMELDDGECVMDGEPRPLRGWINVFPPFVHAVFVLERFYYLHRLVQMVSDMLGSRPFRRKPWGVAATVLAALTLIMPALYAMQKRHWLILAARHLRIRWSLLLGGIVTPWSVSGDLCRLGKSELGVLLDILSRGTESSVRVYGHKVANAGKIYELCDSSFFSIDRIRTVAARVAGNGPVKERIIRNIEARLKLDFIA